MATGSELIADSSSNFDDEIKKLMGKGKVFLVRSEFLDAVKCFEEATKKLDEKYGQAADECGEAYFYYGKSLLEVARMDGGVLGNALQGAIDSNLQQNGGDCSSDQTAADKAESTDASAGSSQGMSTDGNTTQNNDVDVTLKSNEIEKESTSQQAPDATAIDTSKEDLKDTLNNESTVEIDSCNKDEPMVEETSQRDEQQTSQVEEVAKPLGDEEQGIDSKENTGKVEENKDENKDDDDDDGGAEDDDDGAEDDDDDDPMDVQDVDIKNSNDEEEPTYMELAWQMLEISRIIFKRREEKENLMVAQSHLKLGEIQMEQEQFLGAVEDFLKCLDIQKQHLSADNRLLAETAYNLGLAFSFQSMYEKSKDYYSQALDTICLRIASLQKSIEEAESKSKGKDKASPDNPLIADKKEIQELQELLPEIKARVDDATEMCKQDKTNIASVKGNGSQTTIGFGHSCSSTTEPVTMIATKKKTPVATSDISHLVHRSKRKPDDTEADDTVAKKPRQDLEATESSDKPPATNGNTQAAATEN